MILTCDRYPREIDGVEERLKSRFGWGLTVAVEPPDLRDAGRNSDEEGRAKSDYAGARCGLFYCAANTL